MTEYINKVTGYSKLLDSLKLFDTVPANKKTRRRDKSNFRPMSILPLMSKVFEKVIFDQLCNYMNKFLNTLLCVFRCAFILLNMFYLDYSVPGKNIDNYGFVGTIFIDLSEAYNCLPHDLFIAKLSNMVFA